MSPSLAAAAQPSHEIDVIDDAFLAELASDYGVDIQRSLIATFVMDVGERMPRLTAAARACDREAVRQLAHMVRGTAANFHAPRLTRLATSLEAAAKADAPLDPAWTIDVAHAIAAAFERVQQALVDRGLLH
jgi:HPt (histidine-containing phosphotransfer) domain-containing protein